MEIDYYNLNRGTGTPDYEYMSNLKCFQLISQEPYQIFQNIIDAFKIKNIETLIIIYDLNKYDITYKDFFEIMKLCINKNNNIEQKQTILNNGPHIISMFIDNLKKYYDVNKIDFLCYLLEYFKFDFQDINICKKILLLFDYNTYWDIVKHYNKTKFDETIGIFKYIKIILQNTYIGCKILDNVDESINNLKPYHILLEEHQTLNDNSTLDVSESFVVYKILCLKDINIFKLLLLLNYANINMSKWYRYIILFSNVEVFKLYLEFKQIKPTKNDLDFFWKTFDENISYLHSLIKIDFIFYFYENFEFQIDTEKILYLLKSNTKTEFIKLINLIHYLNNNDFCYSYLNILYDKQEIISFIDEYPNILDDHYVEYIENIILNSESIDCNNNYCNATFQIIKYIITKYPNTSTYYNIHQILANALEKCTTDVIELLSDFVFTVFDIKSHNNFVFKSVYQIGNEIYNSQWDRWVFEWFCSKVESEYYEVYFDSNIIIGYRDCIDKILCGYVNNTFTNNNNTNNEEIYNNGISIRYQNIINEISCPYCRQSIYPLERLK